MNATAEDLEARDDDTEETRGDARELFATENRYLTFALGADAFALPIEVVVEIVGLERTTPIPDAPPFVRGVINLRGKVVPVLDVRARFGLPHVEYNNRTCTIVVEFDEITVGLIVDTVRDVREVPPGCIEPPLQVAQARFEQFLQGVARTGNELTLILSAAELLALPTDTNEEDE